MERGKLFLSRAADFNGENYFRALAVHAGKEEKINFRGNVRFSENKSDFIFDFFLEKLH